MKKKFLEKDAKVTYQTYKDFFWSAPINCVLIPITLILFLVSQGVITVYYRFLADFDSVKNGSSGIFTSFALYWGLLVAIVVVFFIALLIKYYCLNIALLKAT